MEIKIELRSKIVHASLSGCFRLLLDIQRERELMDTTVVKLQSGHSEPWVCDVPS